MKYFRLMKLSLCARIAVIGILALVYVSAGYSQDIPANAVPHLETIPAGSLIIPMDDTLQNDGGSGNSRRFNLKAYGLIQELLWNNIPVKWAISSTKVKDGGDLTAIAKIDGTAGAGASTKFSGGPFIIPQGYEAIARQVITAFKALKPVNDNSDTKASLIKVYVTTADTPGVDIRYTIVHKPQIGIGQNTGTTSGVHQKLYDFSMIKHYANIDNTTINASSCYTIATQPHFDSPNFISNFNQFLASGGNVLLQCLSITTFENTATGHFQTTNGWTGYANGNITPATLNYDAATMPYSQFIGGIPTDITAAVADYDLVGVSNGGTHNNFFPVVRNNAVTNHPTSYIASQAVIPSANTAGGAVFELGGHDYFISGTSAGNASNEQYNAQRMILNALFVPVTRPAACGLAVPTLGAYKSVQLKADGDVNHNGLVNLGDQLTWTIVYVNSSLVDYPNFQIADPLDTTKISFVPGSMTVVATNGAVASANLAYTGTGANTNLLAAGASLPHDTGSGPGLIVIRFKTTVTATTGQIVNQTTASGTNVAASQASSDTLDNLTATLQSIQGGVTPPSDGGLIPQPQQTNSVNPTVAFILSPTAAEASISGRVLSSTGLTVARALVTVLDPVTQTTKTGYTNISGAFAISGLEVGKLYSVSVTHPNFTFTNSAQTFVVNDNVSGLVFVADAPPSRKPVNPPAALSTQRVR
jgi:uncharacterized repeat protein (TIGR01451 family)